MLGSNANMRTILPFYFLVTFIQLSLEAPLLTKYKLEAKIKDGVAFTSPGFENGRYPDRTEKYWELYAPNAKKIRIMFEEFDVEFHQHCMWDKVIVSRTGCELLMTSGKGDVELCGQLRGYEFDSDNTPVCVKFSSDHIVSRPGFKAVAFAVPENAGSNENLSNFQSTGELISSSTSPVTKGTKNTGAGNLDSTNIPLQTSPTSDVLKASSSSSSSSSSSLSSSSSSSSSSSLSSSTTTTSSSTTRKFLPPQQSLSASSSASVLSSVFTSLSTMTTTKTITTPSSTKLSSSVTLTNDSTSSTNLENISKETSTISTSLSPALSVSNKSSTSTITSKTKKVTTKTSSLLPSSSSTETSNISPVLSSLSSATSESSATTSSSAAITNSTKVLTLDIIIGEFDKNSIDIGHLTEITLQSSTDETGRYPLNRHDVLTIFNQHNAEIKIDFIDLDIEFHPQCGWDYVQLTIGNESPYRLCGRTQPEAITTTAYVINVVFHSDHIVPSQGFKMKFTRFSGVTTAVTSKLESSTITSNTNTTNGAGQAAILSTKVTDNANDLSSTSQSLITVSKNLGASTKSSTVSSQSNTSSHFLSTYYTQTTLTNILSSIGSGQTPAVTQSATVESTSSSATLASNLSVTTSASRTNAESSASSVASTSSADTSTEKINTITRSSSTTQSTVSASSFSSTMDSKTENTSVIEVVICEFEDSSVDMSGLNEIVVKSPIDESGKYPLNTIGVLTVHNHMHQEVDIKFKHFDIEFHPSCIWDYVKLKLDDEPSYRLCGSKLPTPRITDASKIEIEFHSDHIRCLTGFEMTLTQLKTLITDGTSSTTSPAVSTNTSQTSTVTSQETFTTAAGSKSTSVSVGQFTSSSQSTSKAVPSSSQLPEESVSVSESTINGEQLSGAPEIEHPMTLTTVQQSLSSSSPKTLTTIHRDSTTSPNNVQTDIDSTSMKSVTTLPSSAITKTPLYGSSKEASPKPNSSTSQSLSEVSTTSYTSTPSQSKMEEEQFLMTPGNHGNLKETSTKHTFVSTTSSVNNQTLSTSDNTKASSETSETSTTQTEHSTWNHEGILTTEFSTGVSSTVSNTMTSAASTSAALTRSASRESIACSTDMMPEVIKGTSGYISSPGYGNTEEYPPSSNCQWKITADEKKVIMIIFDSFDVEESAGCKWDKLTFYETSNDGETKTKLVMLCGSNIPSTLSSNKSLLVEFKSDSARQGAGFRFQYIKVQAEPGRTFTCPPGRIPCVSSGACIPIEWWCDNSVDCDDRSDELYCHKCLPNQIQCGNGKCLDKSKSCDGIAQCPYATDERDCVFISNISIHEQPVQVNVQGSWFPLCHDDVTESMGDDVCKAANYRSIELLNRENVTDIQLFSRATSELGRLHFNTSSVCPSNEVVHLRCTHSDCGLQREHFRKKRIIGGSVSSKGEWPWSVALRLGNTVLCGGSIIDSLWVVTAGHCVNDLVANPQILSVIVGINDINDAERQIRYVSEVVVHPEYHYIFNADIALLRLQRPLSFDENTKPICLPWDLRKFSPWDLCYVTGFGVSDMKNYYTTVTPKFLRHVKTKIFDLEQCKDIYSTRFSSGDRIKNNMLCAGYTSSGMDACKGDSGGGLVCKGADDRWLLAGVVSWGDMCGMTNRPGVYTNVVSFMEWIANTTKSDGVKNVTCDFETSGWCGYTDISTGSYVWTRKPGDKFVKGTILYATRTSVGNSDGPMNASLLTPKFTSFEDRCLTFSFMFSGNSNITLSVFGLDDSDGNQSVSDLLWRATSHYPAKDSWLTTEVTVADTYTRLKFVSLNEHGGITGLGLDNITLTNGRCVGSNFMSCSFDEGNTCSFNQSNGHNSRNWDVVKENNPAGSHDRQGYFIKGGGNFSSFGYLAFSQLISPELNNTFTSLPRCVAFSFNKMTQSNNDLLLTTYINIGSQLTNQKVFWTSAGANTGEWFPVAVTIPHGVYDHIVFEVQRKEYTREVIEVLLDDIRVTDGVCVH